MNKKLYSLFLFGFSSLVIYLLIYNQIIYPTILPMVKNGVVHIFSDWNVILNANICNERGYNVYLNNPCDPWGRKHVYGSILLYLPFIRNFPQFYSLILPIIINLVFIYISINLFKFQNNIKNLSLFFFIFSTSFILAIERANIDIIIFLILVFIAYNKNNILNYFFLILISIMKFYPISLISIFIFEKKLKKILINIFLISTIIFGILFFQIDQIKDVINNSKAFKAGGIYSFSFDALIGYLSNIKIVLFKTNFSWIKYIIFIISAIIPLIITVKIYFKYIFTNKDIQELVIKNIYENRLYLLSSIIVMTCYFAFSNYIYREIFILGLIPFITKEKEYSKTNFFNFFYNILCFKFIFSSVLIFLDLNNILKHLKPFLGLLKHSIDFFLISLIFIIFVSALYSFLKFQFQSKI